jgi:hypothetical protein
VFVAVEQWASYYGENWSDWAEQFHGYDGYYYRD